MDTTSFGAREFCRLTGVTGETLRHYVSRGIIAPEGVAPNNYRKYSAANAVDMLLTRICRGLELPIPAIIDKANAGIEEQAELYAAHETALEAELESLRLKLARVRQQREMLTAIPSRMGRVELRGAEEVFNLYRLILFGEGGQRSRAALRILDQWMTHPQYTCVALNVPRESLVDPAVDRLPVSIGVGVREEWAKAFDFDLSPPVSFFAKSKNLCTLVATYDPFSLRKSDLNGIFETAESLGVEIASDLTGLLATFCETEKGRLYYISLGFSIK